MADVSKPAPAVEDIRSFLSDLHQSVIHDIVPLSGGFWSSAYGYRTGNQDLVLRLGTVAEGFEIDHAAMQFNGPDLPVPKVLDIGEAFGHAYAISVRHHGRFLEDLTPQEAGVAGPTIVRLLDALRRLPADTSVPHPQLSVAPNSNLSWRRWLLDALVDDPHHHVSGWRSALASDPKLDKLFRQCERRVGEMVGSCPERRDVVHSDLLHRNVLVADDASSVTAVFSWKCATRGDFLYDTAWCTFWDAWHPGIAAVDVWGRITTSLREGAVEELADAPLRHHCYELQIGASHLGWYAWTGDQDGLQAVAARTELILERGPLAEQAEPHQT